MTQRAFITGGSGFVGRSCIRGLRARGYEVVAAARSEAAAQTVARAGAAAVRCDLADEPGLARGMAGVDLVVHAAAKVEQWGPLSEFMRSNVEGTDTVLRAAHTAKVPRLVHVSTEAVLAGRPIVRATETQGRAPRTPAPYALTKALAEERVIAASSPQLATMVVRPRFIWGRGDTSLLPKLVEAVQTGKFAWIAGGHYLTSSCHVDNVVAGILAAAERGRGGEAYFLTDGPPVEFRTFITALIESQGLSAPDRSLPFGVAMSAAWLLEKLWPARAKSPPPLTRTMVWLMGEEVTVDDSKARSELGYAPVITREQGLAELRAQATQTQDAYIHAG